VGRAESRRIRPRRIGALRASWKGRKGQGLVGRRTSWLRAQGSSMGMPSRVAGRGGRVVREQARGR